MRVRFLALAVIMAALLLALPGLLLDVARRLARRARFTVPSRTKETQ